MRHEGNFGVFFSLFPFRRGLFRIGYDEVEHDREHGADRKRGYGHVAYRYRISRDAGDVEAEADGQRYGHDEHVLGVGEIGTAVDERAQTVRGDHAVQDEAGSAHYGRRHMLEYLAEGYEQTEHDGEHRGKENVAGIIVLGYGEHRGILSVRRVCGAAEKCGRHRAEAVAEHGAVQTGVDHEILIAHDGVGGNVAEVLHERDYGKRHRREHRRAHERAVEVAPRAPESPYRRRLLEHDDIAGEERGEVYKFGVAVGHGANAENDRIQIADDEADEYGHDLEKGFGLCDGVDDDYCQRGHYRARPHLPAPRRAAADVILSEDIARERGAGKVHAYDYDDRADDYGREQLLDPLHAHKLDYAREDHVHQPGAYEREHDGERPHVILLSARRRAVHHEQQRGQEREGRAEEHRHLAFGAEIEDYSAHAGADKRERYAHARQHGNGYRGAQHGKHVLQCEHRVPAGIAEQFARLSGFGHFSLSSLLSVFRAVGSRHKKRDPQR